MNSQLGRYLGEVARWMHSDQLQRWVAIGLLEVEQRMRRTDNYQDLPKLRRAPKQYIEEHHQKAESEPLPR